MADEGNHGANAGNTGLLAEVNTGIDAVTGLPYVKDVLHEYKKATDPDDGGFDLGHTKDSGEAIHKWLGRKRVAAQREAKYLKRRVKTELGKMEQRLEGPAEPKQKTLTETAPKAQLTEAAPEIQPEIKPEIKPATTTAPETEGSFRKWARKKTAHVQRRILEEVGNTKRRLAAPDTITEPQTKLAAETPKAVVAEPPVAPVTEAPTTQAAPEVKTEIKVEVKAPEVKAPEIKALETSAHGHGPGVSTEMKAALATTAALEVGNVAAGSEGASAKGKRSRFAAPGSVGYTSVGLSAYGVVNGYKGLNKAIAEGDKLGIALNSASLTTSVGDLTINGFRFAGKGKAVFKYVKCLDKANVLLNVADIFYETYKEKGNFIDTDPDGHTVLGHKSQRFCASTTTAVAGSMGFAFGAASATTIAGLAGTGAVATLSAVVLPAAAAIGAAYVVNKAANTIIDTERTYEDVDKCFRPDQTRHANLVGGMARVLGNDASNKSLTEAGVKVDPATGRVTMETLNAALADPEEGKYALGRLKALIGNVRDQDRQVKEPHMPRWIQFTDAQAQARQDYEYAKMDARSMDSAITEADGYVTDLKKKRADAAAKAQADLDASLKPFNALPAEIQEDIVNKMKRDYPAYKQLAGDKALDEAGYVMAAKITAASDKNLVAEFTKLEANIKPFVDYVEGKALADWQKQNPAATPADIAAERKLLATDLRREALSSPDTFRAKIDKYQAAEQQAQPATNFLPLAQPKPAQGALLVQAQDKPAVTAPRAMAPA